MHTDSGMIGISLSGYMPYMTVASLEMSDEPEIVESMMDMPEHFPKAQVWKNNRRFMATFV